MQCLIAIICKAAILVLLPLVINGQEPIGLCKRFEYDEKLLEKMIRLEVNFESLMSKVKAMETSVNDGLAAITEDRGKLKKEMERMKNEVTETLARTEKEIDVAMERVKKDADDRVTELEKVTIDTISGLGAMYTRWGRTVCPGNATKLYSGYAAGSHNTHSGSHVETLCLPTDPQWSRHHPGQQSTYIYGAEYEGDNARLNAVFGQAIQDHDVPCVTCQSAGRSAAMMIPARTECYSGWHREYTGYLMTSHHTQHRASIKCVDAEPETISGSSGNSNGDLFYFVEAAGQLPDPPYTRGKELTCVVCTQ